MMIWIVYVPPSLSWGGLQVYAGEHIQG